MLWQRWFVWNWGVTTTHHGHVHLQYVFGATAYLQEHMRVLHSGSIQYDFGYEICNLSTQKFVGSFGKRHKKNYWFLKMKKIEEIGSSMLFIFKGWLKFITSFHFCRFLKKVNVSFIRFFKIYQNNRQKV